MFMLRLGRCVDVLYSSMQTMHMLRLGRCVDVLYSSMQTMHLPDPTLRVTLTASRIASSLYLLCDHMLWLSGTGLVAMDSKQWSQWSNKFWLYSITMNLVRDVYEISNLLKANTYVTSQKHYFGHSSRIDVIPGNPLDSSPNQYLKLIEWIVRHKNVCVDTLKNFCDLWIPMTALGHTRLSAQTIGFLGLLSSLIAILQD
ncbi:unnamed protein product [Medioppia subpectinata]|uniref:Peroxisomal membrane protein 11B n=1 Tax=Medioppia subpectinata TaxID=1979941 RepID=A0A7R9KXP7_9ACAR|nr:unnamed protein product [Medioppia subpectinata]CAG2111546.1 unnamed protein product [Medioppia subpectinata]